MTRAFRPQGIKPLAGMVLAAGRGERLRPITDTLPKPLVEVNGRPLIDYALDRLAAAGCTRAVVNVHHLADQVVAHLAARNTGPEIVISREDEALETGGAVVQALPLLGSEPFYVINGDSLWFDANVPALDRLAASFDPERMDGLLLLQHTVAAVGYDDDKPGDFLLEDGLHPRRRSESEVAPYLFAGLQILSPKLFEGVAPGRFSLNRIYDKAIAAGRLQAIVHDCDWYTVTDEAGLARVRRRLDQPRRIRP